MCPNARARSCSPRSDITSRPATQPPPRQQCAAVSVLYHGRCGLGLATSVAKMHPSFVRQAGVTVLLGSAASATCNVSMGPPLPPPRLLHSIMWQALQQIWGAVTLGLPGVLEHLQSHPEMHVMQGSLSCVIQLAFRQARQLLPAAAHKWACLPAAGV